MISDSPGESPDARTPSARPTMEHRWGTRIPVDFPVSLENGGKVVAGGRLDNASISGARILTEAEFPPLTRLVVTIEATASGRTYTIRLAACVVRREPGAIAVEWRDMASPPLVDALHEASADAQLWARDSAFL
jgi:hypothetical protein